MQNSIADSSHQLLSDLIEYYELNDFKVTDKAIINSVNGSDFLFKGLHRNEQSVKSTEGIDIAWVEEAQTVSNSSLEILTPTVRKKGSQIVYTYNRLEEEDPVHKRLVLEGRPNALIINVNYDVALKYGLMPDVIREEMEDDKKYRPELYKHKWLGEPESLTEDRVYSGWQLIDDIPHEARLEGYGIDFGFNPDPVALIAVYYYNGGYIFDELLYAKDVDNQMLGKTLLNLPKALCVADSAEPKSIQEIRNYGINIVGAEKGPDSVRYGIKTVQGAKISVTRRSTNILNEYRNLLHARDKKTGEFIFNKYEGERHALDAIRYKITSLIPIQKRKEALYKLPKIPKQKKNIAV
jgi:phage terminase large subunit